jgi:hypothetical protein
MRKTIAAALGVVLAAVLAIAFSPAPAQADPDGWRNNITHYAPDDGYDDAIIVKCIKYRTDGSWWLAQVSVAEGQSAFGLGCNDVQQVYVRSGEQIKCMDNYWRVLGVTIWQIQWDSTGWHNVGTYPQVGEDYWCVEQLD